MNRLAIIGSALACMLSAVHPLRAQLERRAGPPGSESSVNEKGTPKDPRFPYAGVWMGSRTMSEGMHDELGLRFTVANGKYAGAMLHPGGGTAPHQHLALTSAGLSWDSPNSGGGTWVYNVRLVGPDSLTGTLVLRDAPATLNPAPRGTLVMTRKPATRAPATRTPAK